MTIPEYFEPSNIKHLREWEFYQSNGYWSRRFMEHIDEVEAFWPGQLRDKIVKYFVNRELRGKV